MTTDTATTLADGPDLVALRDRQQRVWSSGDYNRIAAITVPVSETLVAEAGVRPGSRVLDVATGTGHAALAAARLGAHAAGVDYVPALVDIARAAAERLAVDLVEGYAEDLPFPDASFDTVLSAIGVMFAADHPRAAAELVRVTARRPHRAGQLDPRRLRRRHARHRRPPRRTAGRGSLALGLGRHRDRRRAPRRGRRRRTVLAAPGHAEVHRRGGVRGPLPGLLRPTHAAAAALSPQGRAALRADLVAHADAAAHPASPEDHLVVDWEFRIVTADRRASHEHRYSGLGRAAAAERLRQARLVRPGRRLRASTRTTRTSRRNRQEDF